MIDREEFYAVNRFFFTLAHLEEHLFDDDDDDDEDEDDGNHDGGSARGNGRVGDGDKGVIETIEGSVDRSGEIGAKSHGVSAGAVSEGKATGSLRSRKADDAARRSTSRAESSRNAMSMDRPQERQPVSRDAKGKLQQKKKQAPRPYHPKRDMAEASIFRGKSKERSQATATTRTIEGVAERGYADDDEDVVEVEAVVTAMAREEETAQSGGSEKTVHVPWSQRGAEWAEAEARSMSL